MCSGATGGASGCDPAPSNAANFTDTVDLPVGGTITYTVTALIGAGATGNLVNTVTVTPPAGGTPGTATDTDTPTASTDLAITKTNGASTYIPGSATTYTIVVTNNGPSNATGAAVADTVPAAITGASWTCTASVGSSCTAANGAGSIATTVNLTVGGTATFLLQGTISPAQTTDLINTATVTAGAGQIDPNLANNTATDTDTLGLGVENGHFDFDNFYATSGGTTSTWARDLHTHRYDDEWDVTGVNMLNASDLRFNLSRAPAVGTTTQFKVLVMNQYLNPAAKLAIGPGTTEVTVKDYGGMTTAADAATMLAAQTIYTRGQAGMRLIVNLPIYGFNAIDWWGDGGIPRAGLIPTRYSCAWTISSTGVAQLGPNGERHDGALTIQLIRATTPASAIEYNRGTDPKYGWRVKAANFTTYVLAEYIIYWHHPNELCYGDATWTPAPGPDTASGTPTPRPSGTADPVGPIPPNPTPVP